MSHASCGAAEAHLLAFAAAGGVAVLLQVRVPNVDTFDSAASLVRNPRRDSFLRRKRKENLSWFLSSRKRRIALWRGSDRAKWLWAPPLGLWAAHDGPGFPYGFAVTNPMVWCTPVAAKPEAFRPARLQQDVHVFVGTLSPDHFLAEFQAFLVDLFAEEPLMSRTAINASQVRCGYIGNMFHEPRHQGML